VPYIQLLGGLIWLLMGGDLLVRGAVALADRARVPQVVVALSVVAFGTSLPELVVTVRAVFAGYPGVGIGNVVGSNIANALLVIGAPAIVHPLVCTEGSARRNSAIMVSISLFFLLLCSLGDLGRLTGAVLLASMALLVWYTARTTVRAKREADEAPEIEWVLGLPTKVRMIALFIVAGAVGLPLGARLLVDAAVVVAEQLQISNAVAGLTIVALGTSLPELATSIVAARQRHTGVVIGAAIGSNVFNMLAIMGTAALVSPAPIPVPPGFLSLDLPVMVGGSLFLTFLVWRRRPIGRWVGVGMVAGYSAYLVALLGLA
jgi:cation:H+ antiporter